MVSVFTDIYLHTFRVEYVSYGSIYTYKKAGNGMKKKRYSNLNCYKGRPPHSHYALIHMRYAVIAVLCYAKWESDGNGKGTANFFPFEIVKM